MKNVISFLAAFLLVAIVNANNPSVKIIKEKSKIDLILNNYKKNWNKLPPPNVDKEMLANAIHERGVSNSFNIKEAFIFEKDGTKMMIVLDEQNSLYEFDVTVSFNCPCYCGNPKPGQGYDPIDYNGDGDCYDFAECSVACQGPGNPGSSGGR